MPKTLKIQLAPNQHTELNRLALLAELRPRFRQRLEMVRLSDLGLSVAQLAAALQVHYQTVAKFINAFEAGGFEALHDQPHLGPAPKLLEEHLVALEAELDRAANGGRTYTLAQLLEWLETHYQLKLSKGHLYRVLSKRGFSWKRTKTSLQHKKVDPEFHLAKIAEVETLT